MGGGPYTDRPVEGAAVASAEGKVDDGDDDDGDDDDGDDVSKGALLDAGSIFAAYCSGVNGTRGRWLTRVICAYK